MTEQVDNIALREALKKMFSVGTHSLQFTKKDGTVREMIATRDPALMPFETYEKWLVPNVENRVKNQKHLCQYMKLQLKVSVVLGLIV